MKAALLGEIQALRHAKRPFALVTDLESGAQRLVEPGAGGEVDAALRERVASALGRDRSESFESESRRYFLQVYNPPLRLLVVGAVHIAQPLAAMAARAGFAVSIVDPRAAFASEERFPGVSISSEWPDQALASLAPDARTAIVTLTHDPKLDDPALATALRSPAFYIGSLGSVKTHRARLTRLAKAGFSEAERSRIHGPVGLAIGAQSPAEIAVAILAQIIEALRRPAS